MKQKIISFSLIAATFLTFSPTAFASSQAIQVKQTANKKKIVQTIKVNQLGDLNQALIDSVFNASVPNPKKNFKIVQKIKIKQLGNYNLADVTPTINALLGNNPNVKVVQKVKVKQKGNRNKVNTNPTININSL